MDPFAQPISTEMDRCGAAEVQHWSPSMARGKSVTPYLMNKNMSTSCKKVWFPVDFPSTHPFDADGISAVGFVTMFSFF